MRQTLKFADAETLTQLSLTSLREWTLREMEHELVTPIERVKEPSRLCMGSGSPIAVLSVWETLIEAQNNRHFKTFSVVNGLTEADIFGEIVGWKKFSHGSIDSREIWMPSVSIPSMPMVEEGIIYGNYSDKKMGSFNPYKSFQDSKTLVSRTMRKIEGLDQHLIWDITVTLPSEVDMKSISRPLDTERRCKKIIKKLFAWFADNQGGKLAVNSNYHAWSSANPLKAHAHFHNIVLGSVVNNDYQVIRTMPKNFSKKVLDDFKGKWAELVNAEFGTSYETLDVRFQYIEASDEGRRKLVHKLKYNRRRPLADLALFFLDNAFEIGNNNPTWSNYLINYRNRPLTLGYWNRMSKVKGSHAVEGKKGEVRCSLCGLPLVYVGFEYGKKLPSSVQKVFIDRSNRVYLIDSGGGS
jgi:hypothetical protein